ALEAVRLDPPGCGPAELTSETFVHQQRLQCGRQFHGASRAHQEAGPPVLDDLGHRRRTTGNHGQPGRHRLGEDKPESFLDGRKAEAVGARIFYRERPAAYLAESGLGTTTRSARAVLARSQRACRESSARTQPRSLRSSSAMIPLSSTTNGRPPRRRAHRKPSRSTPTTTSPSGGESVA